LDEKLVEEFLDKKNVIAVVGASKDPDKYGHRVYRDLKGGGYKVYAVNPNGDEILGDKCHPRLEAVSEKPDVVDVVAPPKVTEAVVSGLQRLPFPSS
jgi:predicted CoA-binding protein